MTLEESDFSGLLAAGYQFPEPFKVKAADGVTDLYGVMYKPFNFDSTALYPIIDYVYPGPQVEATVYPFSRMSVHGSSGTSRFCRDHGREPGRTSEPFEMVS